MIFCWSDYCSLGLISRIWSHAFFMKSYSGTDEIGLTSSQELIVKVTEILQASTSHWLEINPGGSIYIQETDKYYKSGLCFVLLESQLLNIYQHTTVLKAQQLLNGESITEITFLNKLFKIPANFSNFSATPKYTPVIYKGTWSIHVNVFLSAKWS